MRQPAQLPAIAMVSVAALFLLGCPQPESIVGSWELSAWSGACEGDPNTVFMITFEEGGGGSTDTFASVSWTQEGGDVQFTVTPTRGSAAMAEGEVVSRNTMEGTIDGLFGTGCWEAVRLAELP